MHLAYHRDKLARALVARGTKHAIGVLAAIAFEYVLAKLDQNRSGANIESDIIEDGIPPE